jgi:hypothetical protein
MKEKAAPKKLKGTVLYTVVSVLMVLIVFLMGTLALAATANKRAYTNYQKEQTEYTARTVLDSVVEAINSDTTTTGIKYQIANLTTAGSSIDVNVTGTDGLSETVTITNVEERQYYVGNSDGTGEWKPYTIYELSTTVSRTLANTTYTVRIADEQVTSTVVTGGGGGAFVSLGGIGGKIGTAGFTSGGTEVGVGGTGDEDFEIDNQAVQMIPFYVNGNLNTKSQCTAYFNKIASGQFYAVTGNLTISNTFNFQVADDFSWPYDSSTSYTDIPCVYVGKTLKLESNTVSFGVAKSGTSDSLPLNVYVGNLETDINFNLYGDLYAFDETATSHITSSQGTTALYNWVSKTIKDSAGNEKTEIFGNFYSAGNVEFSVTNNGHTVQGDLRVAKDLTITGGNNKAVAVTGDAVCGGTLTVGSGTVLNCKNLYADTLVVNGTINCTGTVNVNHIAGTGVINCTTLKYADSNVVYATSKAVWYDNLTTESGRVQYDWGFGEYYASYTATQHTKTTYSDGTSSETQTTVSGKSTQWGSAPDMNALTANIVAHDSEANAIVDTYGAPDNAWTSATPQTPVAVQEVSDKYGQDVYPADYTQTRITTDIVVAPTASAYQSYPSTLSEIDASFGILDGYGNYSIPTYSGWNTPDKITTSCVLTGTSTKNIYIEPQGSPLVIVVDNFNIQDGKSIIINDNNGTVYFFVRSSSGTSFTLSGGSIVTTDYLELIYGHPLSESDIRTMNFKQVIGLMQNPLSISKVQTAGSVYFPNVYIYGEQNSGSAKSSLYLGNNCLMTANVRAPYLSFSQGTSSTIGKSIDYLETNDNGTTTTAKYNSGSYVGVIGQLICNEINVSNQWGLIYVTTGSTTGGSPTATPTGTVNIPDRYTTLYYSYY